MSTRESIHASLKNTTKLIVRHHKYAWVFTLVAVLVVSGIYFKKNLADAATYTFTQSSWAGVMDATTATHTSNQTGWTKYSAKDTGVTAGTTVALTPTTFTATDDGMIANPGFESGTTVDADSWAESANATRVSDRAHSGSYSMKFTTPSAAQATTQSSIPVNSNTKYTLSGWIYLSSNTASNYLDLSDIAEECSAYASASQDTWQFVSCSFTTGATRTSVTPRLVSGISTGNAWFDDISLLATTATNATGGTFGAGTNSSTAISGTGSGASVGLAFANTLSAKTDYGTGTGPMGVAISPDGTSVYVGRYSSTYVLMFPRNTSTGALSTTTGYGTGTSPKGVAISPNGTSVYVTNQMSATISMYSRNTSNGTLSAKTDYTTGISSYPIGVAISPDGTSVYVANSNAATISMYSRNTSTGALSTKTDYGTGVNPYGITISADGTSVYVANSVDNTISMYSRNTSTGALTALATPTIGTGANPGDITISADGTSVYVANSVDNTISMYSRNTSTGALTALATPTIGTGTYPSAVTISADGTSVYVANATSATISMYSRNTSNGTLSAKTDYGTGTTPRGVAISPDGTSVYVANGGSATVSMYSRNYFSSGTFTSAAVNLGAASAFTTLSWNATLNGQTLTIKARSSADGVTWRTNGGTSNSWTNCTTLTSGGNLSAGGCVTNGDQYIQYQAALSGNAAATPTLNDITFNYAQYPASGTLTSSIYNTEAAANLISKISWTGSGTSGTEIVKFQIRSSSDGATWSGWCGMADTGTTCAGTNYFTTSAASFPAVGTHPLNTGGDDQYLQYKVTLLGSGATPTLSSVVVQYVVNAPPTVSNVTAVQGSSGTVAVTYGVADTDSSSETITLQYCPTGSACTVGSDTNWVNATTVTGNVGAGVTLGTGKSIVWTPATDYASQYNATELIRVKANDGDAANNLGYGVSSAFILDTTAPVITVSTLDSSGTQDIVNLTTTDNSTLTYRLCNTADFAACASWTSITSGVATPVNWTATGAPATETVYLEVRDAYANTTARTLTAPATPTNLLAADVSNPSAQSFGETLSWLSVTNATSYKVYSAYTSSASSAPSSYTLLATPSTNVYQHTITTATTSAYWYRVAAVNSNGDISNFTTLQTLGDVPDSFGTTLPDTTAPTIDPASIAVPTATLKNTSAVVTFTTNELAIAKVYYGTTNYGTACSSYATHITTASYVTAQSVSLPGLTASTPYYYCLKAVDTLGNPLVDPSTGVDGSIIAPLTTAGGPTITGLQPTTVTDTSATITWNTSTSSDSYVYYSTNASVSESKNAGSATLVSCVGSVCQHSVGISGLIAGTKYYYFVKSTDGVGNTTPSAIDNFTTTIDITPPVISAIATPVTSSNAVVIVWTTDEPATTQVYYGGTAGSRPNFTTLDTTKSIYHVATLSSATLNAKAGATDVLLSNNVLTASTPYYYTVTSADVAGNSATSAEQTVTTPSTGSVTIVAVSVAAPVTTAGTTPDTTAPSISNVKVADITPFGATVTFDTSEDAVSFVEYGKDTSYRQNEGDTVFTSAHTVKLHGLTLGTEYHLRVKAIDKSGNTGTGEDQTFKTTFLSEDIKDMTKVENIEQFQKEIEDTIASILPSLIPPFVGRPQITDITEDGATVSFTTNIKSFPVVGFVEENLFDATKDNPYTGETSDTTEKKTSHELTLAGLKPNTTYHIQARAFSLPQVIGKSKDYSFTTKASKIVASIIERKKDSFTVLWTTLEPTSSIIEYKNIKSGRIARVADDVKKTSHAMKIENLPSATSYEVNVSGINEKGNVVEAGSSLSVTTSKDITPPALSGFKVANALVPGRTDRIQTIISWATDEPADSVVYYEEGVGTAGDTKELANNASVPDLSTNHNVILSSLKPGAIYRIKITSTDDSGNTGIFGPRTVITPRQTESITDIIFKNFEDSFKFLRQM